MSSRKRLHLFLLILGAIFIFPSAADAAEIFNQHFDDTPTNFAASNDMYAIDATYAGTIEYAGIWASTNNPDFELAFSIPGEDCSTESKTAAAWGIATPNDGADNLEPVIVGPFSGSDCDVSKSGFTGVALLLTTGWSSSGLQGTNDSQMQIAFWSSYPGPIDPIGTTGVVTPIVSPSFPPIATTSSPIDINFIYTIATEEDALRYDSYRLQFKNADTGAVIDRWGTLDVSDVGTFSQSTSTPLSGDGTWDLYIFLAGKITNPEDLSYGKWIYAGRGSHTFFGLNTVTNTSIYQQYLPPQRSTYTAASCAINFLGTFDLLDCLGYIIVPTTGSTSPLISFQNISLRERFPFAYAYQLGTLRDLLFTSTPTGTTSVSVVVGEGEGAWHITFLSKQMLQDIPLSSTVKTIITWLLFFMLAEFVYHRILKVHDKI